MDEKKLSIKAIILGFLAALIPAMVINMGIGIYITMDFFKNGGDPTQAAMVVQGNSTLMWAFVLIGLICDVIGGFVCGKIAKRDAIRHTLWLGVIAVGIGILLTVGTSFIPQPEGVEKPSMLYTIVGFALTIPAYMAGGYFAADSPEEETA